VAKTPAGVGAERMRELARHGAEAMLTRLRAEITALERAFPELAARAGRRVQAARKRARRAMTAAEKKAVSQRMKKYWAGRKKATG